MGPVIVPGIQIGEENAVEAALLHARNVDVAVGVARAEIEMRVEEALRGVVVSVDDDGMHMQFAGVRAIFSGSEPSRSTGWPASRIPRKHQRQNCASIWSPQGEIDYRSDGIWAKYISRLFLYAEAFPFVVPFRRAFGKIQPIPDGVLEDLAIDFVIRFGEGNALGTHFDAILALSQS